MLGLNPDQPIRLPSRRTAWRIAGVGFAAYLCIAVYIRYADVGVPMPPDPLLGGCFQNAQGVDACFDWSEDRDVPQLTLRISEDDSDRAFILTFDHRRLRTLMPGSNTDRRTLALRSVLHQNSFGRPVTDGSYGPRECRLDKWASDLNDKAASWTSDRDCRKADPAVRTRITLDEDDLTIAIGVDGRVFAYTMPRE